MSKSKFAVGALIGVVAGAVAGVLTAPKSGKETREDIKRKAGELKEEANEAAGKAKQQADKLAKDAQATVDDYKGRTSRAVESARKEFSDQAKK